MRARPLRKDTKLPFLDIAWSSSKVREFFNRSVLPAVWPGLEVTRVEREFTAYKPGKECKILYLLGFGDAARDVPRFAKVTFGKRARLENVYARHYGRERDPSRGPTLGAALFLPEFGFLVEFFPADWELPSLRWAGDPGKVAELLPRAMPGNGSAVPARLLDVEVLRYRPGRACVLRYVVESHEGHRIELIGKVYPKGPKAAEVWRKLDTLCEPAMAGGLIIPKPFAMTGRRGLLFMQRVPGIEMNKMLKGTVAECRARELIGIAAAALTSFQRLPFASRDLRSIGSEFEKLRQRATRLGAVAPLLAQRVDTLLTRMAPLVPRFLAGTPSLVHGDYKPSQLLVDDGRVAVVDLDRACLGDPALDVGNFMANLHREALLNGRDHLRRLSTFFLAKHQAGSPEDGLAQRARLYQSIALVRIAVRSFEGSPGRYARRGPEWRPLRLLDEAAACLRALEMGGR